MRELFAWLRRRPSPGADIVEQQAGTDETPAHSVSSRSNETSKVDAIPAAPQTESVEQKPPEVEPTADGTAMQAPPGPSVPPLSAAPVEPQQAPRSVVRRGPRPGEQWLYLEASNVDVASVLRAIDGVQKVMREDGGFWKIVAERDINAEAARNIITRGGALTLLLSTPSLPKLGLVREGER